MSGAPPHFLDHIAIFGGAFDPPHVGHVEAARGLLKNPGVKSVLVVPSYGTPLKTGATPFETRVEMTRLAFQGLEPEVAVSAVEGEIRAQYAWQLIERLKAQYPKIAYVIGSDQLMKLHKWGRYPQILDLCDWIVLDRKGVPESVPAPAKMVRVETQAICVSSSKVREEMALGHDDTIKTLLPPAVREYIERQKVYG